MSLPWEDLWAAKEAGDAAAEDDARDRLALLGAMLLGAAAERCGRATRDAMDRAGVTPAVWAAIEAAVEPMGEPLQRIYGWMSLEVRRLRAENWELARWAAQLETRIELLEQGQREQKAAADGPSGTSDGSERGRRGGTPGTFDVGSGFGGGPPGVAGPAEVEVLAAGDHGL